MPVNIYSKKFQTIIRIFCAVTICFFIFSIGIEFYKLYKGIEPENSLFSEVGIVANSISIVLCLILAIFPTKIGIIGIIGFFYSLLISYIDPISVASIFMFFVGYTNFLARGFYNKFKKTKHFFTLGLLVVLLLLPLASGFWIFIQTFFQNSVFTFVSILILFFFNMYQTNNGKTDILNINDYEGLTKRDCEWLHAIVNNEKYESIALTYKMSLGSVKNRLKFIFETLEVGDKIGFLNTYSNYKIVFGDEETKETEQQ